MEDEALETSERLSDLVTLDLLNGKLWYQCETLKLRGPSTALLIAKHTPDSTPSIILPCLDSSKVSVARIMELLGNEEVKLRLGGSTPVVVVALVNTDSSLSYYSNTLGLPSPHQPSSV